MPQNEQLSASARACMERINAGDQLLKHLGVELVECRPGYGKAVMPLDSRQLNAAGMAHGGAIFSLADIVMALAANNGGQLAVTLSANIAFLKASPHGPYTAEAREIGASSKVSNYEVCVTDAEGQLVAKMQAIAYKKHAQTL